MRKTSQSLTFSTAIITLLLGLGMMILLYPSSIHQWWSFKSFKRTSDGVTMGRSCSEMTRRRSWFNLMCHPMPVWPLNGFKGVNEKRDVAFFIHSLCTVVR